MEDEEAVLKKKLEDTTNFEERREIRQKLRELRKKKLDALESATTAANERPRRRDRVKREEQTTIITETKTTSGDSLEPSTVQTKVEVSYSHTVATDEPSENGIENGHVESESVVEEETVSAKEENPVEEQPGEGESAAQLSIEINGKKSFQDKDEEVVLAPQSELSTETETVEKSSETVNEDEPPQDNEEEEVEEVELTPEVIEKMEDLDQLEKLLEDVPLNEYALRKAIRLQIRQLRVKKEVNKDSEIGLGLRRKDRVNQNDDLPGNNASLGNQPSESSRSPISDDRGLSSGTETMASVSIDEDNVEPDIDSVKPQAVASDSDADDASSTVSSLTSESASEPEVVKTPPPRPPKPSRPLSSTPVERKSDAELSEDFKTRVRGSSATPPRDLSKKPKSSGPEQVDFRNQLKKTGLRADRDLTAQGKRQQQGDFRGQLRSTGVDTSRNLSALRNIGKKKEGPAQVDFRGLLNKSKGSESPVDKKAPPRPPPTYLSKKADSGASASRTSVESQSTDGKEGVKDTKSKGVRKISSADLLNMLHKPVETSKESYLVQRGIKKAEASKSMTQKFVAPSTSTTDETLQARMAVRKERSEKLVLPVKDPQGQRKTSKDEEMKDFRTVLRKAAAQKSRVLPKGSELQGEEETSVGEAKRNERFSIDIQDKNELAKLRADLLRQKEKQDKEPLGTKTVTTVTEKTVEETDEGQGTRTTEVKKMTEVHKTGEGTTTVTKTTKTTTGGSKGASIDALFAQKKKERMMAKKKAEANTKDRRNAFKQQLEAQAPKVEGGRKFTSGNTAVNQLQEWCRRRTKFHEGVDIQNFTTSWANGLAMCALLNYFLPEKIPYETLDPQDKKGNWTLAFKVANEEGIEPLLELEDVMAVDVPEPKSLITYVHFVYQHFAEKKQQQQA